MKKTLLGVLAASSLLLPACSITTESEAASQNAEEEEAVEVTPKDETIEILGTSESMTTMNVLRDQLVENGFDVTFNIQPDFASVLTQREAGNYDILSLGWTTVTGAPDYAVRSLYHSEGDSSTISNPEVDELIDTAALQIADEYTETYAELEELLIEENAYTAPLYTSYKPMAYNHDVLDPESLTNYKAREMPWEYISFADDSQNTASPLVLAQRYVELTSLDPIQANDASVSKINTNMYSRLVNLDENDNVTSEGSLSLNHAIAEGEEDYYFLLHDNINFAAMEDGEAVDTGELVSGNDAVYSVNRASDAESVPDHRSHSLFSSIENAELVTDTSELESTQTTGGGQTVMEALEEGVETPVENLTENEDEVNNDEGNYQVVKVSTDEPFPQILNNLSHVSAGIVSEEQVESVNDFEVEEYNPSTHTGYGDQSALIPGPTYDNHLYASGPYIMSEKNNTEANFQKNPAYMPDTEHQPTISNIDLRLISDPTSSLSALRSGEVHLLDELPTTKYEVVEEEGHLTLDIIPSNGVYYVQFNTDKPTTGNANFRKSIMYSIDQEEISAINNGYTLPAYTTLTPVIDTGNTGIEPSKEKVEGYYQEYLNDKEQAE